MASLSAQWEYLIDLGGATHRFTSGADLPTIALTKLVGPDVIVLAPNTTTTVWDATVSPVAAFDYLYLSALDADVQIELSIKVAASTQVQVFTLKANSLPLTLADDTAYFTVGGTSGLVVKVRATTSSANTVDARLVFAVGLA